MIMQAIETVLEQQRAFFKSQKTKDINFRKEQLKKLKQLLLENEKLLFEAIYKDFGKSEFETVATELSIIYNEIDYFLKNLSKLSKPKRVRTNLANLPGNSKIYYDPLGCCLVIGAWNYPFQLSLAPAVAALAAGNCCILKPSEVSEHSMNLMAKLINKNFLSEYFHVETGGVPETTEILKLRFDKIFFTGSPRVGKIVYEAAAKHLTPVTLELGGKSPVIVTPSANLEVAAKRIVWGKFLNASQTCIAPDYILAHHSIAQPLIEGLKKYIKKFNYTSDSDHYTRIINSNHFNRLTAMIDSDKVVEGGNYDSEKLYIAPTVLFPVSWSDKVMEEEIFGPILPILTFDNFDDALHNILENEKPLSAYLFSSDSTEKEKFTKNISFGGGCINDVVMHISNARLPFGGVGNSGIGSYHGHFGFEAFSHQKSVLNRATWGEPNIKYPPYSESKFKWIRKLL